VCGKLIVVPTSLVAASAWRLNDLNYEIDMLMTTH